MILLVENTSWLHAKTFNGGKPFAEGGGWCYGRDYVSIKKFNYEKPGNSSPVKVTTQRGG